MAPSVQRKVQLEIWLLGEKERTREGPSRMIRRIELLVPSSSGKEEEKL
jgi:hypothetical protein